MMQKASCWTGTELIDRPRVSLLMWSMQMQLSCYLVFQTLMQSVELNGVCGHWQASSFICAFLSVRYGVPCHLPVWREQFLYFLCTQGERKTKRIGKKKSPALCLTPGCLSLRSEIAIKEPELLALHLVLLQQNVLVHFRVIFSLPLQSSAWNFNMVWILNTMFPYKKCSFLGANTWRFFPPTWNCFNHMFKIWGHFKKIG